MDSVNYSTSIRNVCQVFGIVIYFFSWLTLALILGLIYFFYLDGSKKKGMEYGTEIIKIQILCSFVSCLMAIIG